MGHAKRLCLAAAVTACALVLGACATPTSVKPGDQIAVFNSKLKPTLEFDRPGGGKRYIYATGPSGQYAWAIETDAGGKVQSNQPILTSPHFDTINDGMAEGRWNADRLRYEFGPPARISRVGVHGEQIVWSYRFKENDVWNSLMYVYLNDKGIVTRFHPGPDPAFEPGMFLFW